MHSFSNCLKFLKKSISILGQIYLKEVASFLSWNGREMTHWADLADIKMKELSLINIALVTPSLSLSLHGSLVELSTSKQSSQLARVRVTPGTRFIDIRLQTLRPERDLDDIRKMSK